MCIFVSLFSHYMAKKGQKMQTSPIVYIFNNFNLISISYLMRERCRVTLKKALSNVLLFSIQKSSSSLMLNQVLNF